MKFIWITKDGKTHTKFVEGYEERLRFIDWLETAAEVVKWW